MENPLSNEQIKKINEILKLPEEERNKEFNKFLKILKPEQIEFLKKQQGIDQCPFCLIIEGKIKTRKVYEDENIIAFLDINPANKGHTLVVPKRHYETIVEIPYELLTETIKVVKKVAEALNADGTNILLNNKKIAGQLVPHLHFHVIPRSEEDGLSFTWEPKKFSEEEMEEVERLLRNNIINIFVKEKPKEEKKEKEEYRERVRVP